MKKLIALLLAMVMVLALAACGGGSSAPAAEEAAPAEEAAAPAEEPAEAPAEEAAPAEEPAAPAEGEASGEPTGEPAAAAEPIEDVEPLAPIVVSISNQETETAGQLMKFFAEKVEEISGGAMTLNVAYGGSLVSDDDIMSALATGAVQLTTLSHVRQTAFLPVLTSIPDYAPTSSQNAIDYFNELMFKNPETSAIINAEAEKNNIKYLAGQAGGANALVAQYDFDGLQDFISKSTAFGNMEAIKWSALGLNVVSVFPWDYYQAFETGQMDSTQMASTPMISMSIQELAKYWMYDNTYTAGQFVTVNLDFWNGLTEKQQSVLQAAADALEAESIRVYDEALATEQQTLEDAGVTLVEMSQEDFDNIYWPNIIEAKKDDALILAEQNGNVDDVKTILQAAADFTGYDIQF